MQDNIQRILDTTAILVFFALPVTVAAGGAMFVPWRREFWNLAHWTRMLREHGWVLVGLVAMLVPVFLQSQVDPFFTTTLGLDFTPFFQDLEGGFHENLQRDLQPAQPVLQPVMASAYVFGYPALLILTPALGIWLNRRELARRALGGYALCFAFAVPFFLFFPVNEVWFAYNTCPPGSLDLAACNQGPVRNLAIAAHPFIAQNIYAYNEINNCFPSLHTAMSVAMAAIAWRSRAPRGYRYFSATLAAFIVLSTIYLGIHWVSDVIAGLVLAAVVVKLVERIWPTPAPQPPAPEAAA